MHTWQHWQVVVLLVVLLCVLRVREFKLSSSIALWHCWQLQEVQFDYFNRLAGRLEHQSPPPPRAGPGIGLKALAGLIELIFPGSTQ